MAHIPKDLNSFKEIVGQVFDNYDPGKDVNRTLKAYLIESNIKTPPLMEGYSDWNQLGGSWSICSRNDNFFVLNKGKGRIWTIFTLSSVDISDNTIEKWTRNSGLDRCWFSGDYLQKFGEKNNWIERGLGIKYSNSLLPKDEGMHFSLKAWHGVDVDDDIKQLFLKAKEKFTTTSVRWRSYKDSNVNMKSEWYNDGKITIQYSDSVSELFSYIFQLNESYENSLKKAEEYRNQNKGAFEFVFDCKIDIEKYSKALNDGKSSLKLWMLETYSEEDFKRFSGIDLHTGDRVLLDMGDNYAYMTIPGKGCVNATPRFLTISGENALGHVKAYYEGSEIFNEPNF